MFPKLWNNTDFPETSSGGPKSISRHNVKTGRDDLLPPGALSTGFDLYWSPTTQRVQSPLSIKNLWRPVSERDKMIIIMRYTFDRASLFCWADFYDYHSCFTELAGDADLSHSGGPPHTGLTDLARKEISSRTSSVACDIETSESWKVSYACKPHTLGWTSVFFSVGLVLKYQTEMFSIWLLPRNFVGLNLGREKG